MTDPDGSDQHNKVTQSQLPPPPGAAVELESGTASGGGVSNILRRWKREDLVKRGSLAARALGFVFSFLAFILVASNKHGDWKDFDRYEEYRYLLAIAILSSLYTGLQTVRQIHQLYTGRELFHVHRKNLVVADFFGDQIIAYLLISAASSAIPLTNRMRENADNIFTDTSAAAISMEILAFLSLAVSALIAGYKISNQSSYI